MRSAKYTNEEYEKHGQLCICRNLKENKLAWTVSLIGNNVIHTCLSSLPNAINLWLLENINSQKNIIKNKTSKILILKNVKVTGKKHPWQIKETKAIYYKLQQREIYKKKL